MSIDKRSNCLGKRLSVDRRIADEQGSNRLEQLPQPRRRYQTTAQHRLHVRQVAGVTAFELGQSLRVGIVVKEVDVADAFDVRAPVAPARKRGDELIRRSELDVDIEVVLDRGNALEDAVGLRIELQI